MKLFLLPPLGEDHNLSISEIRVLPDNVIINSGKQLFKPEWIRDLYYTPVLLVRMEKVAKSLESRFAGRYYEKGALGLSFIADAVDEGIPEQLIYSFDDSIVRGDDWRNIGDLSQMTLSVVQVEGATPLSDNALPPLEFPDVPMIEESISYISKYFMLKIGDLMAFPLWSRRELIRPEQGVFVTDSNEKELLFCGVK
ncbi:hypothetical protein QYZ87_05485 [Porphyromonadaceae bacterium W3.11]|nr:hypothetical protein [Porphyromonadaceae bacterium W3.11]